MGGTRMIWSKVAREKLDKELDLYLDAAIFPFQFQHTDVLRVASDNIRAVIKDLTAIMLSKSADKQQQQKDDVSLIINECRLKVVNQLQYICDNNASDSKAFKDFLVHFKSKLQGHLYDTISTGKGGKGGTSNKKRKAPQLTKLELQQQKDDEKKLDLCLEKQETVKQLKMDYQKTVGFMERFILTKEATEKERILIDAYRNITNDYHELYNIYGYQEEEKWLNLDVSSMVKEYKSKVEKELKEICDKVYDPTIKEAFSRHLTDVTADTIPAQNHHPHLCNNVEKRMSSKQKKSAIQKKKRSRRLMRRLELISVQNEQNEQSCLEDDHSQCCCEIDDFDLMCAHLMKSPPKEEEYREEYLEEDCELEFVVCNDIDVRSECCF